MIHEEALVPDENGLLTAYLESSISSSETVDPKIPPNWPPAGPTTRITMKGPLLLKNYRNDVVCTLGPIVTDIRAYETDVAPGPRVTLGSTTTIYCLHNQWVKDDDDPASWTPMIWITHVFYAAGHFDDPAYAREFPLGWSVRTCGRNMFLQPATWPAYPNDVKQEHLWPSDPLPGFDSRGRTFVKFDGRLSGFCGP